MGFCCMIYMEIFQENMHLFIFLLSASYPKVVIIENYNLDLFKILYMFVKHLFLVNIATFHHYKFLYTTFRIFLPCLDIIALIYIFIFTVFFKIKKF